MKTTQIGFLALLLAGASWAGPALAHSDRDYTATDPAYRAECGSCHLAYPPELLPASSWRALMTGLDKHFGTDASLDPTTAARIAAFLERNAGRERGAVARPPLRITETRWFAHEHDEVSGRVWKSAKVKSASNCAACHTGAERGDFDEDSVRIPK